MTGFDAEKFAKEHDDMNFIQRLKLAYQQGRAEALEEAIHKLDNCTANCHEDYIDGIHFAIGVLEELKEQNE